ncbi:MAG: hypothetical protein E7568_03465 [Ruminococcaceae bacterium]|nr:hypothetical protein [Oscillospiraceae bacterium]
MKRILCFILTICVLCSFAGCFQQNKNETQEIEVTAEMTKKEKEVADTLKAVYGGFPLGVVESYILEGTKETADAVLNEASDFRNLSVDNIIVKEICPYDSGKMYAVGVLYTNDIAVNDVIVVIGGKIVFQPLYSDSEQGNIIDTVDGMKKKTQACFNAINDKFNVLEIVSTPLSARDEIYILKNQQGERLALPSEQFD